MPATKETFKTYEATTLVGNRVLVINSGKSKTGEPLLKVRVMRYRGYAGDHSPRMVYTYGDSLWIKADQIATRH